MEIRSSYLLSVDSLYTLLNREDNITEGGTKFIEIFFKNAQLSDLEELVDKKMARRSNGVLVLDPVVKLIVVSIGHACAVSEKKDGVWVESSRVNLKCQKYRYLDNIIKITPSLAKSEYIEDFDFY